jgi:hypothetical protein
MPLTSKLAIILYLAELMYVLAILYHSFGMATGGTESVSSDADDLAVALVSLDNRDFLPEFLFELFDYFLVCFSVSRGISGLYPDLAAFVINVQDAKLFRVGNHFGINDLGLHAIRNFLFWSVSCALFASVI